MLQKFDVIVIGAGAAGLMCAARAASRGRSVLVLDHANKAGKKILMSGGGRCNFTNYYVAPDKYLSHNPHFCKSALKRYSQWDFIALVDGYGIAYHEKKDGQLFCDNKASDILNLLLSECEQQGVHIRLNTRVAEVQPVNDGLYRYLLKAEPVYKAEGRAEAGQQDEDYALQCESLVIATGGPSIPTLGATGFGYDIARQFGLKVYAPRAALVPFTLTDHNKVLSSALSGTSLAVEVECNDQLFADDLLFTHRGLSGPAILQISSYWKDGDSVSINLLPGHDIAAELRQLQHSRPKVRLKTWLAELTTQKFAEQWLAGLFRDDILLADLSGADMDAFAQGLHQWQVKPAGTEGYRTAEVAQGGVDTDEVSSKTLECKTRPGLFFIGEVLDVTGHLGGFNFQWAWSSAVAAGEYV
ncbi:MAG: aminoacetone oxidase family FAD-binding enzyme [Oceanospirillaceae bacterium]|nr:aminoacetone oxidase family FAD-binding enzyme [Oceanospirillaceae bacterium]MBT11935.1 aminoacetone oxidase family FAD-binding enzyme [Oceanospirillaceae bacterium]